MKKVSIFIAYSHEDEYYLNQLYTHLKVFERSERVEIWYDRNIQPGRVWDQQIKDQLYEADLVLPLISSDFISSDYAYLEELRRALYRQRIEETIVVPILIRSALWEQTPLQDLQIQPRGAKPIGEWDHPDSAYKKIAEEISELIDKIYHIKTGQQRLLDRDFVGAIQELDKAIDIDQSYALAYLRKSIAYYELGDLELALNSQLKALEYNQDLSLRNILKNICFRVKITKGDHIHWNTGFFISNNGWAITSIEDVPSHISNYDELKIEWWYNGKYNTAEIFSIDDKNHLAILDIELPYDLKFMTSFLPLGYIEDPVTNTEKLSGRYVCLGGYSQNQNKIESLYLEGRINIDKNDSSENAVNVSIKDYTNHYDDLNGAPLIDIVSRTIIGIQIQVNDSKQETLVQLFSESIKDFVTTDVRGQLDPLTINELQGKEFGPVEQESTAYPERTVSTSSLNSITPEQLILGPMVAFNNEVNCALSSPIIKAWVDKHNESIIIIGQGIYDVYSEILREVAAVLISTDLSPNCAIANGCIYLAASKLNILVQKDNINENEEAEEEISEDSTNLIYQFTRNSLGGGRINPSSNSINPKIAIQRLAGYLKKLEHETGCVEVNYHSSDKIQDFDQFFTRQIKNVCRRNKKIIIEPNLETQNHFIQIEPYVLLQKRPKSVSITFPKELLATKEFLELIGEYYKLAGSKLYTDVKRRLTFWRQRYNTDAHSYQYFNSLSIEEKKNLEPVTLNQGFDPDLAISFPIPPEKRPAADFFNALPDRMKMAQDQINELSVLAENINRKMRSPDTGIQKIFESFLFDCVLRNIPPSNDEHILKLFAEWQKLVFPGLHQTWTDYLEKSSISSEDIFTNHTFFTISYKENDSVVKLTAFSIYDSNHSTIELNNANGISKVLDPTDFAENSATGFYENELYKDLSNLVASLDPESISQGFEYEKDNIHSKVTMNTAFERVWRHYRIGAYHTMNEIVQDFDETHEVGSLYLAQAIVKFVTGETTHLGNFEQIIKACIEDDVIDREDPEISRLIKKAIRYNKPFVEKFHNGEMQLWYPEKLNPTERTYYTLLQLFDSIKLINVFQLANSDINLHGESQNTMFFKLAKAFDTAFSSRYNDFPISPLFDELWRQVSQAPSDHDYFGKIKRV